MQRTAWRRPRAWSISNWCARKGRPATGTSDLGIFSVMGRSRMASPPARMATGICEIEVMQSQEKYPTSNLQLPTSNKSPNCEPLGVGCWILDVGCSLGGRGSRNDQLGPFKIKTEAHFFQAALAHRLIDRKSVV